MTRSRRDWPIIIGGCHRSGTTLVRRLINGHSRIFCPPEIKFFKDMLCQFANDPLAHGRLSRSISALGLPTETWLGLFGRTFVQCYELAAERHGKQRWADKNPENTINANHWDHLLDGELFFLLVVRHPYDIIASMAEVRMDKTIAASTEGRARHILEFVEPGLTFVEQHPDRACMIRYEDLVKDPARAMSKILEHFGESFEPGILEDIGSDKHGLGLEDPKARHRNEISSDNVGRWTRDLSREQIAIASAILAPLKRTLGYCGEA